KLSAQIRAMARCESAAMCFTNFNFFNNFAGVEILRDNIPLPQEFIQKIYPLLFQIRHNVIVTPSVMIRTSAVLAAGCFDESMDGCEDIDLWGRITRSQQPIALHAKHVGVHLRELPEKFPYAKSFRHRRQL